MSSEKHKENTSLIFKAVIIYLKFIEYFSFFQ